MKNLLPDLVNKKEKLISLIIQGRPDALILSDGNLITASGIAPLEFSVQVLKSLGVFSPKTLDAWYSLNKTYEAKYFHELMDSIQ